MNGAEVAMALYPERGRDVLALPAGRLIPLRRRNGSVRGYAIVDSADYDRVAEHRWHRHSNGYAMRQEALAGGGCRWVRMHRFVLAAAAAAEARARLMPGSIEALLVTTGRGVMGLPSKRPRAVSAAGTVTEEETLDGTTV